MMARWKSWSIYGMVAFVMCWGRGASATSFTWTGAQDGNWNTLFVFFTNWAGNVRPTSAATNSLEFSSSTTTTIVNNDIASPFVLNNLTFAGSPFTLTGGTLQFRSNGTVAPTIFLNTPADQTINNALTFDNPVTVTGSGLAAITFHGLLGGAGSLNEGVP